jgi:4-hydroxybenzoate polyprenyltransferase
MRALEVVTAMNLVETGLGRPLCIDLDRHLLRTELLLECVLVLLKRGPVYWLLIPVWLLRGRDVLKAQVTQRVRLDPATLPYDAALLSWLRNERAVGRRIWLCTRADELWAEGVALHLGLFDRVIVSDSIHNPKWRAGIQHLLELTYLRAAAGRGERRRHQWVMARLRNCWRAMRPHQWVKNVLLFVPLIAAHRAGDPSEVGGLVLSFVAFSLCASSVYVLNDLLDLKADRAHARKCSRPFAAGDLPLGVGFALIPVLLAAAAAIAATLPPRFAWTLAGYYALTVAYSFALKDMIFVDVMALAGLYTLRIIAGAAAVEVVPSFWLLLFSVFLFLSLAVVKRYAELDALRRRGNFQAAARDYDLADLPMVESVGISAGYLSVLVLALYVNSPNTLLLYRRPEVLWVLCALLLYWITRIWMKTHRGKMHDDPVVFAMRDRVSLATGVAAALVVAMAI